MPLKRNDVPIVGERVEAALEFEGVTLRELGRRIAVSWYGGAPKPNDAKSIATSVANIAKGKSRYCDRDLRRSLAEHLRVPEVWLAGEMEVWDLTPVREQLLQRRALEAFDAAIRREVPARDPFLAIELVAFVRGRLIEPEAWRRVLLSPKPGAATRRRRVPAEKAAAARVAAMAHLLEAFRYILDPWVQNEADLSADGVTALNAMNEILDQQFSAELKRRRKTAPGGKA